MPRHGRAGSEEAPRPTPGDAELLFEETPGFSLDLPVRPDRWLGDRLHRLPPLPRALLGGFFALVLVAAAIAFVMATTAHPPAAAPAPSSVLAPQPLAASTLPDGCTLSPIDAVHSLAQCVQCDARLSNYGLLCHFRDTVVVSSPPRPAVGCVLLPGGSLTCTTPTPPATGSGRGGGG
jgi:hypothetical protein